MGFKWGIKEGPPKQLPNIRQAWYTDLEIETGTWSKKGLEKNWPSLIRARTKEFRILLQAAEQG